MNRRVMCCSDKGRTHRDLVVGLQTGHALTLGRNLVSCFHLPATDCSVAVFREPRLEVMVMGEKKGCFPDLLAIVRSGGALFSAIVEVKRTARDLLASGRQYRKYLGCTPAFFIAVPSDLIHIALAEIRSPLGLLPFKGLVNADSGDVVVLPRVQQYDVMRGLGFISEALGRESAGRDVWRGLYVPTSPPDADMVEIDGMIVRKTYAPIVLSESRRGYPRDEYYDKCNGYTPVGLAEIRRNIEC